MQCSIKKQKNERRFFAPLRMTDGVVITEKDSSLRSE